MWTTRTTLTSRNIKILDGEAIFTAHLLSTPLDNHIKLNHCCKYTVGRPLIRNVLFCFLPEVLVNNWSVQQLQYQPNGRWNMSKTLNKPLWMRSRLTVQCPANFTTTHCHLNIFPFSYGMQSWTDQDIRGEKEEAVFLRGGHGGPGYGFTITTILIISRC